MKLTAAGKLGVGDATVPIATIHAKGSFATKTTTLTENSLTLDDTHHIILVDDDDTAVFGDVTITLPAASGNDGLQYIIKKLGNSEDVIIDGNGTETIDGDLTAPIYGQYNSITLVCDGSNWHII